MTIKPGSRLGPYEIASKIGEGGMGQVWRGRDTRLEREVAIKILPAGFAANPQSLARFEREAKLISSMNHPHICTLHDIGHEDDTHFLVMELIDGESLVERLKRGPLPPSEALRYGAQIADALDQAHKQGIVHRDLKPGNVMLTRDGAKLLDFGLARPVGEAAPVHSISRTATHAGPLTAEGTIVGTFQYMAPEQLEGQEADARTDIFALGALLYEMATGRPAFQGESRTSLIAAIVSTDPPPISTVQAMMPPALDHVVRNCLHKQPDDRWQSAHDVASQLRWIDEAGSQAGVATAVATTRRRRRNLATLAATAGLVIVAAVGGWIAARLQAPVDTGPVLRAELAPPPELGIEDVVTGTVVLSPDGGRLAFLGSGFLNVRDLASGEVSSLQGTDGAGFPFWSPDGEWLAFFAGEKLKKVRAGGGPVQVVADAHAGRGGTWNPAGEIVFAADITGPLRVVSADGGATTAVTELPHESVTHRNPHFLPDGKRFLFTQRDSRAQPFGDIAVASLDAPEPQVLVERASNPKFEDGYLFFVRDRNLMAQAFDPSALAPTGSLVPIADAVEYYNPRDIGNFSVAGGMLVYRQSRDRETQLAWFDLKGRELETVGQPGYLSNAYISRDGSRVSLLRRESSSSGHDIWVMDLGRGQLTRSTFFSANSASTGVFSPDGRRLAVTSQGASAGRAEDSLWIQLASGSGQPDPLLEHTMFRVGDWSPDGRYLVGTIQLPETAHDIAYVDLENPEVRPLVQTRFTEVDGTIAPNGKWVAYVSDEAGGSEVYLIEFPGAARKWQVSTAGGFSPLWSADSRTLHYGTPEGYFAASITETGSTVEIGAPRKLSDFERGLASMPITVEGDRVLALKYASEAQPQPLRLIRNWKAGL